MMVGYEFRKRLLAASAIALASAGLAQAQTTTNYTYDALGRVVSAVDSNGPKVKYDYDRAGNRIRVSNGEAFQQFTAIFRASSTQGTTGLQNSSAMQDGAYSAPNTIHATVSEAAPWIEADLGAVRNINNIRIAAADSASLGLGPAQLNGAVIEYSLDRSSWQAGPTISGVVAGAPSSISLGGVQARYVRIRRAAGGKLAIGDFMLFSAAADTGAKLVALDDEASTTVGVAKTVSPLANDYAIDGGAPVISGFGQGGYGTVAQSGSNLTYTPNVSFVGADSFVYSISNGSGDIVGATVRVTVTSAPGNRAPVTGADAVAVLAGQAKTFDVLGNDTDADSDTLTITNFVQPSHGMVVRNGVQFTYTPNAGHTGVDSFTYDISDGRGGTATGTVTLNVSASLPNTSPVANSDSYTATQGVALTFDPTSNDTDADGDTLSVVSVTASASPKGVAVKNGPKSVTYTPNATATGQDTLTYSLSDGRGGTAMGAVTITIATPNTVPVAANDTAATTAGVPKLIEPLTNDTDADGDTLTIVEAIGASSGQTSISADLRSITYTPNAGFTGNDSFTYKISDGRGGQATARVDVTIVGGGVFTITPSVSGKSTWNLAVDGALNLNTPGAWTIVPQTAFTSAVKAWGGGGGNGTCCVATNGGAGGFAGGSVSFAAGVSYTVHVAGGGTGTAGGTNGGGAPGGGAFHGGGGGGYSGIRLQTGGAVLVAGGGGGGGHGGAGGGGGGGPLGQIGSMHATDAAGGWGGNEGLGTPFQGMNGTTYGGGGGGGYRGGGPGQSNGTGGGGGGGGGGYIDNTRVTSSQLLMGSATTPGAEADAQRNGAAAPAAAGRIIIGPPPN